MKYYVYTRDILEDFDTKSAALDYIEDLLDDYCIDEFVIIEGRQLKLSYKVEAE